MKEFSKYVGLDVHKETIAVSVAEADGGEVRYVGEIANTPEAMVKLVKQLKKGDARLRFCYEAGPCGYVIYRQLQELKQDCQVVAPSLIPKKAGDRVKTDRRDSLSLARLHRTGELTAVWIPDGLQEALRDLTCAREDMKHLQRQAKQRLLAFLLRHGKRYTGKSNWTQAHLRWLETVKFEQPVQQIVLQEYIDTVTACGKRVQGLDQQIERTAQTSAVWPVIEALMALHGVNLLTATTVVAEIGDLKRFANAPQLMGYLGLVPSEHSSGGSTRRGGIDIFIPIAEDAGLVQLVSRDAKQLFERYPDFHIGINLAPQDLHASSSIAMVRQPVKDTGATPGKVGFFRSLCRSQIFGPV